MAKVKFDLSAPHEDNFRVHFWMNGRDKGRVSAPIRSWEQAEAWIRDWKEAGESFAKDDLRIHDLRSIGHITDNEAA